MLKKKKGKKYYLEKMRNGQITDAEVAMIFNTSISNVRHAFIDFSKRKNPFYQRNFNLLSIAEILISVISVVLVYSTLLEMQTARNNAYRPGIYFNKTAFAITWNADGTLNSDYADDEFFQNLYHTTNYINAIPTVNLSNIGMGTAKNIHLEWVHSRNMRVLTDFLYTINSNASFSYEIRDGFTTISTDGTIMRTTHKPSVDISYMKNDTQNESISIPYEYFECLRHICCNYTGGLDFPTIQIAINYLDVQGKQYHIEKTIKINPVLLTLNPDSSGYAIFELIEV